VKQAIEASPNAGAPSGVNVAFAVAVPGVQDYDTITVDRDLLRRQIDFMVNAHISSEEPEAGDYREGILNLLEGILDLGWPPEEDEEAADDA